MKRIFIGSSFEAIEQVKRVAAILQRAFGSEIQIEPWYEAFGPGTFTMETLANMSRRISGAILLATPDDASVIRGREVMVPRANVMLELGYFIGVLGCHRTAVCKYEEAELPTDLSGLTHIKMGNYSNSQPKGQINTEANRKIRNWVRTLPEIVEGIPSVQIVHAYSGRWDFEAECQEWFGISIDPPNWVSTKGSWDFCIPNDGKGGYGTTSGVVHVKIGECHAEFKVNERAFDFDCSPDGKLRFKLEPHIRQRVRSSCEHLQIKGFEEQLEGHGDQQWEFTPDKGSPAKLVGERKDVHLGIKQRIIAKKKGL